MKIRFKLNGEVDVDCSDCEYLKKTSQQQLEYGSTFCIKDDHECTCDDLPRKCPALDDVSDNIRIINIESASV